MNQIRNMIAIFVLIAILPLSTMAFKFVSDIPFEYNEINDELALLQLREYLLISYDIKNNYSNVTFTYKGSDFSLNYVNRRLLMQPGTQIILNDIDDVYFIERSNCVYVVYQRENKTFERAIVFKNGIYLDEFSDCFIDDDVFDRD